MGTRSDSVVSAAPVRTKRRDTSDIICSGKCGSGAAGRCGVSGRLLLAKVRGGRRSAGLSAPPRPRAGGWGGLAPPRLAGVLLVKKRPATKGRLLLLPLVGLDANPLVTAV